ncbi:MAG: leucine-rich repeat domain-containing protein [Bacteroidaceae bacterium]|nr:leucine-rich repeat domain-containing protein [Bacteroidaceae bacterium]
MKQKNNIKENQQMRTNLMRLVAGAILATLFLPLSAQHPGGFDFDLQHVRTHMPKESFTEGGLKFETNDKYKDDDIVEVSVQDDSFVKDSTLYLPCTVMHNGRQYRVVAVRAWGLAGCTGIRRVVIGEGVRAIYERAFLMCTNLESVSIPKSMEFLDEALFYGCERLRHITVEEGNEHFDSRNGCNAVIDKDNLLIAGCGATVIPSDVEGIFPGAFAGCFSLEHIDIPDGVEDIGRWAFGYCHRLKSVSLPPSLEAISDNAFDYCTSLERIRIPRKVCYVGNLAFARCTALSRIEVDRHNKYFHSRHNGNALIMKKNSSLVAGCRNSVIPEGVKSIRSGAFWGIPISHIHIPRSVENISHKAFSGLKACAGITVDPGNPVYSSPEGSNAIMETASMTLRVGCQNTVIPIGTTRIGDYAFHRGMLPHGLNIPEGVSEIGEEAFYDSDGLVDLILPRSLRKINDDAFFVSHILQNVTVQGNTDDIELGWGVFNGTYCAEQDFIKKWVEKKAPRPWYEKAE